MLFITKSYTVSPLNDDSRELEICVTGVSKESLKTAQNRLSNVGGADVRVVVTISGMEMILRKAMIVNIEVKRGGAYVRFRCLKVESASPVTRAPKLRMW